MDSRWKTFALLCVGLALLLNPWVPGVHLGSETVYRFEAASVEYTTGEGFELRDVPSGTRLEQLPVDDQIVCEEDRYEWTCRAMLFVLRNGSVPGHVSAGATFSDRFEFVHLDDRLYRPTTVDRGDETHLVLRQVNDSDPLEEVAATDPSAVERKAVESGRVVTYQKLSRENQLFRVDGGYYFVRQTGRKHYTGGHDKCRSTGDGFCDAADWKRRTDTAVTLASRVGGLVLLFLGWERTRR